MMSQCDSDSAGDDVMQWLRFWKQQWNFTTNCFGDSESSASEADYVAESSTSSESEGSAGVNWPQFNQAGTGSHGMTSAQAKAFVKIKASHNLKKKILRFRSGSLKLMTTVWETWGTLRSVRMQPIKLASLPYHTIKCLDRNQLHGLKLPVGQLGTHVLSSTMLSPALFYPLDVICCSLFFPTFFVFISNSAFSVTRLHSKYYVHAFLIHGLLFLKIFIA